MKNRLILLLIFICFFCQRSDADNPDFEKLKSAFIKEYSGFHPSGFRYDYREYFNNIPSIGVIEKERNFLLATEEKMAVLDTLKMTQKQRLDLAVMQYEIAFNLTLLKLEEKWINDGRNIPVNGLHELSGYGEWYAFFIRRFTTTNISPEEVFEMGKSEVKRVHAEIKGIRDELGFKDDAAFYRHLNENQFYLTDKEKILDRYKSADSIARHNLKAFIEIDNIPPIHAMEWPDSGPFTPPGMYLNHSNNAYGKDVFLFNFYTRHYNYRVINWLYMHEAIPGHHLQMSLRNTDELLDLFLYPGNFEGWGCYVEYYGKSMGLYDDIYSELGKWEWDLVRSVRLVLDAGIHYFGWSSEEALKYWREHIPGQDDIAEREITRVTNWPGQALSYKVGADAIFRMQDHWLKNHPGADVRDFRSRYLKMGMVPLAVMQEFIK